MTLKRLRPAGSMKFWPVLCSPVPTCLLCGEEKARGGFMIHSFQCCWLKGKERNCSWFGRLLRETFLEIQLSEPAQKYVLAGSCRQLICLAVFSFPVRRTNIHTGENTHWGRLLPFHLTCFFCPRTGTGWQFLQLSPDCKEVSRATDVGPL